MKKEKRQQRDSGFFSCAHAAFLLIFLNTGMFVFSHFTPAGRQFFQQMILHAGGLAQGRYLSLLAAGFLHADWVHLAMNMLGIFIFGRIVQERMGFKTTLFVYFGSLMISMVCFLVIYLAVFQKNVGIIGASGAVMGLMAAAMLLAPFSITWEMLFPIPTMVKGWMFFYADLKGLMGGESDGVSHLAHLCGFLSILVLLYFLSQQDQKKLTAGFVINLVSLAVVFWVRMKFFI